MATPYVAENLVGHLSSIGEGISAMSDRLIDTSLVAPGTVYVVMAGWLVAGAVVLLALAGALRRLWMGRIDVVPALLATVPLLLFAMPYGGEVMFRAYLFALPFLSFFAAAAFFPNARTQMAPLISLLLAAVLSSLAIGFVVANNGKDKEYSFTAGEVAAAHWLYANAPSGTLLIEGSPSYPGQFMNYENFFSSLGPGEGSGTGCNTQGSGWHLLALDAES